MKRDYGLGDYITFQIDPSMNFALNTYELVGSLPGGNNNLQLGDAIFTMKWVT